MGQIKRQRIYEGLNGVLDKWTIDFNSGQPANLSDRLISAQPMMSGSKVAVVVATSGCAGIAGNMVLRGSMEDSGAPSFPLGASVTPPASGADQTGVDAEIFFGGSHLVLDCSGITWPTEGRMTITIVSKI